MCNFQAIRWQGKPKCAIFYFFFDKLYIFSTTQGGKPPIHAMQILSWILYYKFRLDSGDLCGWLIGAVRSFHTAEYGRAVQGAVVGESSTTDEGCKAIVSHTSPNSQGIPNLRWLSKVSRSLRLQNLKEVLTSFGWVCQTFDMSHLFFVRACKIIKPATK